MRLIAFTLLSTAVCLFLLSDRTSAQLTVLSSGNVNLQWRSTQLELIDKQLSDSEVRGPLRFELESQKQWLESWSSGSLTEAPLLEQEQIDELLIEPILDPNGSVTKLREKLLGKDAHPTIKDTEALLGALKSSPNDVGVRQLHLHWLDQKHYREEYSAEIAESARKLAAMLAKAKPQSDELKIAQAYCHYRCARALAYRELPEVVDKKPIEDLQAHEAEILSAYRQLVDLVGGGRPEFILLEVRMLRRDHWYGQALSVLEKHGKIIEPQWFLEKRRDLLEDLGWTAPAQEAAEIFAAAFPAESAAK